MCDWLCKSPISNADLTRALRSDDIVLLQVMRLFGDRVLLIFDDADVRSKMLASDILSKLFDRFVEWNEEDCAMGCFRDSQSSSTDSERMENPTQDVPAEQEENESMATLEGIGTMVCLAGERVMEGLKVVSCSSVLGVCSGFG
ncbi:hypothetical protein V6N11_061857 [Hibiscus sabdariffa]|uniref:Uncharacterized protein n=1 Tax=Hibiscus sabdariffa TaxID=183260 RepID=A0ABR2NC84_9ROSI